MSSKLPSLPLFVDDYEAATPHLSLEEDGAYMRLLRLCWRMPQCSMPDDPAWIARRMRVDDETYARIVRPIVDEFFTRAKGRIFQKRLRAESRRVTEAVRKRKDAGKRGGAAKALKSNDSSASNATLLLEQNPGNALAPIPIPIPIPKEEKKEGGADAQTAPVFRWEGKVIRLVELDYQRWRKAYPAIIDFDAALQAADDYYAENPPKDGKWFFPVSNWLKRENERALADDRKGVFGDDHWN